MDHGKELSSIDFAGMIGGPLVAVIEAQAKAAITTVNFIKEVGFKKPERQTGDEEDSQTGDPIYVSFKYPKEVKPYEPATEDGPEKPAVFQEMKLEVPLLCIVPIPYLRVEEVTIDFNAKINSMQTNERASSFGVNAQAEGKARWLLGSAKLKVSTAYQSSSKSTSKVQRTYSLAVQVKAVQNEMPGGMEKILGILEDAIKSQPVSAPEPKIT